jgi:hypothetical protein
VAAVLTAGGHHRVAMSEVRRLLGERASAVETTAGAGGAARCWEYFSEDGAIREACAQCAVYRFRAARCYEVPEAAGQACGEARMCTGPCTACPYYLRAHRLPQRVLAVSRDEGWVAELKRQVSGELEIAVAGGVYEASMLVGEVLPGGVVLDAELPAAEMEALREGLKRDRRIPWVRVFVAGGEAGTVARQVSVEELLPLLNGARVEEVEA